ncbi:MAG: AraC family transcriptional regulator [Ruminococcaceae bacterium]|nr:AraC family transcriptional regulator [Oscillospiraceae bacterium]
MTVNDLIKTEQFVEVSLPDGEREINGVYIGDLLSWVMGNAQADNAWITIMSNINVVAVASLIDVSCVILAEGVSLDDEVKAAAQNKGINVVSTTASAYETAVMLSKILL